MLFRSAVSVSSKQGQVQSAKSMPIRSGSIILRKPNCRTPAEIQRAQPYKQDSSAEMSAQNAHKNGAWIGICGELAADTTLTETFLRMGIDELSVSPTFVLKVRDAVRKTDLSK